MWWMIEDTDNYNKYPSMAMSHILILETQHACSHYIYLQNPPVNLYSSARILGHVSLDKDQSHIFFCGGFRKGRSLSGFSLNALKSENKNYFHCMNSILHVRCFKAFEQFFTYLYSENKYLSQWFNKLDMKGGNVCDIIISSLCTV